MYNGTVVGVMGEVDPQVLTNWGIGIPCVACEMDLDGMLG
jgi:phenylalanyl-tRNA synthetase beta chain